MSYPDPFSRPQAMFSFQNTNLSIHLPCCPHQLHPQVCILHCGVTGRSDLASAFLWGWSLASFSIFSIWSFVCSLSSKCWGPSQHSLPRVPLTWASLSLGLSQPGPFTQAVESRTAQPLGLSFKPRPWSLLLLPVASWLSHRGGVWWICSVYSAGCGQHCRSGPTRSGTTIVLINTAIPLVWLSEWSCAVGSWRKWRLIRTTMQKRKEIVRRRYHLILGKWNFEKGAEQIKLWSVVKV